MTFLDEKTIYLRDYTPPPYLVDKTELTFRLDPQKTRVVSKLHMRPNPDHEGGAAVALNGEGLRLIWARVDGQEITPDLSDKLLTFAAQGAPFIFECEVEFAPAENTSLIGLYMSGGMYCTQCEPQGFRKITYFPDRPDVLSTYDVRIESDMPVRLSNGNETHAQEGVSHWHDPWPKPAYLFALVAGDLSQIEDRFVTASGREVVLKLVVRKGDENKTAFAMEALKHSMRWDEERYGREYDLDVFHIVAVDDFNFGAMENKGLNIFNSAVVLANPETTTDRLFERIEAIIAHEYFHNWTGNRITCRDWFQLCLKEGLTVYRDAQFTSDMRSAAVKRVEDAIMIRTRQFSEDAGPLAHPVRPESFVEIDNFYTMTVYEKGAEVVGMLHRIVGDETYYKALDLYFDRHDGQAVTIEDWIKVFEDASGKDLSQFMLWYSQAGTPKVGYRAEHLEDGTVRLHLSQSLAQKSTDTPTRPMQIPVAVGLLDQDGAEILPTTVLELTKPEQSFDLIKTPQMPVVSMLRDFSAPVEITTERPLDELGFLLAHDTNPYCKWDAANVLGLGALSGGDKAAQYAQALSEGWAAILKDHSIDPAFKSLLLSLPMETQVIRHLFDRGDTPDPDRVHGDRRTLLNQLAQRFQDTLLHLYEDMQITESYRPDAAQSARRHLAGVALALTTRTDGGELAKRAFETASNFTDYNNAFGCLLRTAHAHEARKAFAAKWHDDHLVMNGYYGAWVGTAEPRNALAALQEARAASVAAEASGGLSTFSPNRYRALYGAFVGMPAAFHASDGSGYATVKEAILEIEPKNSHLSASLCSVFQNCRMYDKNRRGHANDVIAWLLNDTSISTRTREILERIAAQ